MIKTPSGQACPLHTTTCVDRKQYMVQRRVSNAAGLVFLSDVCPKMWEYRPCSDWATTPAEPDLGMGGLDIGMSMAASDR